MPAVEISRWGTTGSSRARRSSASSASTSRRKRAKRPCRRTAALTRPFCTVAGTPGHSTGLFAFPVSNFPLVPLRPTCTAPPHGPSAHRDPAGSARLWTGESAPLSAMCMNRFSASRTSSTCFSPPSPTAGPSATPPTSLILLSAGKGWPSAIRFSDPLPVDWRNSWKMPTIRRNRWKTSMSYSGASTCSRPTTALRKPSAWPHGACGWPRDPPSA